MGSRGPKYCLLCVGLLFCCSELFAQFAPREVITARTRRELEAEIPQAQSTLMEWGGWIRFSVFDWDDPDGRDRGLQVTDPRVWLSLDYKEAHHIYARLRFTIVDFDHNDSSTDREFWTES